jgi:TatD DNase family protein
VQLIDTHAHLTMDEFADDRQAVISRATEAGIAGIVCAGTDIASSRASLKLAESHDGIVASAGIHPHAAHPLSDEEIAAIAELAHHPKVVAIGEIGLDFYREYSPREGQLAALEQQLDLASGVGLPVIIHCRRAEEAMLPLLAAWTARTKPPAEGRRGVIHCFMADAAALTQYLEMGFMISLAGYITYPTTVVPHDVIRAIPLDRLMVETDSPFLTPQQRRGRRNEPCLVAETAAKLAQIIGLPLEQIAEATTANAHRLFWPQT